jgi:hypothetical protein
LPAGGREGEFNKASIYQLLMISGQFYHEEMKIRVNYRIEIPAPKDIGLRRLTQKSSLRGLYFCHATAGIAGTFWTGASLYQKLSGDRTISATSQTSPPVMTPATKEQFYIYMIIIM